MMVMEPRIGGKVQKTLRVQKGNLAPAAGSGSLPVLATPVVAALLEGAAAALCEACLEEGTATVGTHLDLFHTAPSPEGSLVTAEAELTDFSGRSYRFTLRAWDEAGEIAHGEHERVAVKSGRFLEKAAARLGDNT
jgi:fluoroacetyl-CoA thioesterase